MKPLLIIFERDNSKKDEWFIERLKASPFGKEFGKIIVYKDGLQHTSTFLDEKGKLARLPSPLRKMIKAFMLLRHPSRWNYFLTRSQQPSIKTRCEKAKKYIRQLKKEYPRIVLLGRSSGARIASLIADELGIEKVIAIGYPFKNPKLPDEPERYLHLATLKTPMKIIQGVRDEYGGIEISSKYELSPAISLEFVDTDHDFKGAFSEHFTHLHP